MILKGHTHNVMSVAFSPDGSRLASGSADSTVRIWSLSSGSTVSTLTGHKNCVNSVCYSPDGSSLASGSWDSTVRLWAVDSSTICSRVFRGHVDEVRTVCFSPDGNSLVSGGTDKSIRIWSVTSESKISVSSMAHRDRQCFNMSLWSSSLFKSIPALCILCAFLPTAVSLHRRQTNVLSAYGLCPQTLVR